MSPVASIRARYREMRRAIWMHYKRIGAFRVTVSSPTIGAQDTVIGAELRKHDDGHWSARVVTPLAVATIGWHNP